MKINFNKGILLGLLIVALSVIVLSFKTNYSYDPAMLMFGRSGMVAKVPRVFADTLTPTTASGQTLDISAAGFTKITSCQVQAEFNTATAAAVPVVSIKSYTNSSVVVNILQSNTTAVSILGVNVIGLQFLQSVSGVKLHYTITGY